MDIETFFEKYYKGRDEKLALCENEENFKAKEYSFENYDIGVVSNLKRADKYIVYLYVEAKNDVISHILFKEFKNPLDSTNYFNELSTLAEEGDLDKIAVKMSN